MTKNIISSLLMAITVVILSSSVASPAIAQSTALVAPLPAGAAPANTVGGVAADINLLRMQLSTIFAGCACMPGQNVCAPAPFAPSACASGVSSLESRLASVERRTVSVTIPKSLQDDISAIRAGIVQIRESLGRLATGEQVAALPGQIVASVDVNAKALQADLVAKYGPMWEAAAKRKSGECAEFTDALVALADKDATVSAPIAKAIEACAAAVNLFASKEGIAAVGKCGGVITRKGIVVNTCPDEAYGKEWPVWMAPVLGLAAGMLVALPAYLDCQAPETQGVLFSVGFVVAGGTSLGVSIATDRD